MSLLDCIPYHDVTTPYAERVVSVVSVAMVAKRRTKDAHVPLSQKLRCWYRKVRRDLPWRTNSGFPDPYHVLLSEFMLQQTQVSTVIAYFNRFIESLPTIADLARADEQDVLRLWQGLGYYSRARNLHRAAKAVVQNHGGVIPRSAEQLLELPGIGRYTAGAIASLAYGMREAILDGNVQRVLCRVRAIQDDPRETAVRALLWETAETMLPRTGVAAHNSALMELGATICRPRIPMCGNCPIREHCRAARQGIAERIPLLKPATKRPLHRRWVYVIDADSCWLIEQRPPTGRWAGLWQFPTVTAKGRATLAAMARACPVRAAKAKMLGRIHHDLTHRRYEFVAIHVWATDARAKPTCRWIPPAQLPDYPMSRPQSLIAGMALMAKEPRTRPGQSPQP